VVVGGRRDPCNLCHGTHHHGHHRHSAQYSRTWDILLAAHHACHLDGFIFRWHHRGDLLVSSRHRSIRRLRLWLCRGWFHIRGRAVRLLRRARSRGPPRHWAATCGSSGTRRLRCELQPGAHRCFPGWWREAFAVFAAITVGGTAWAHISILTEPALRGGVAPDPAQPPIWATVRGR
jgi:hypothetical protein